ncbi:hypothetical protein D3C76_1484690 [compost metagenome]
MGVDQGALVPALAQVLQQLGPTGAMTTIDPGLAKTRDQGRWRRQEQHLVLAGRRQAMIEQHPLGPVEAAAVEQMNDRQGAAVAGRAERRVQFRTQWTRLGRLQLRCGLTRSGDCSLITNSTGTSSCWVICAGCLKRWSKNSRT